MWRRVVSEFQTLPGVEWTLRCTTASLQTPISAPTQPFDQLAQYCQLHQQTRDNRAERRIDFALRLAALFCEVSTIGGGRYRSNRRFGTSQERRGLPVLFYTARYGGT
jgi:hypothetical protein